ncbi:MAG: NUDIX hydrolase [Desulfovibrio sp.]|nr:NUDIX hydrolase [Desulfovibrio sp.]
MQACLSPSFTAAHAMQEVVDASNTPLCIMHSEDILRQCLAHRTVGLLVRDRQGRTLLTHRQGVGWGISSFSNLYAGHSHEQQARKLLRDDWGQEGHVQYLQTLLPDTAGLNTFTYMYEAHVSTALATEAARDTSSHMLVDQDELQGLYTNFDSLLSPILRTAVHNGLLRPYCNSQK